MHHTPLGTAVSQPDGNPHGYGFHSYGCPVFSAGDVKMTELIPVMSRASVLEWLREVTLDGDNYVNPYYMTFCDVGENYAAPSTTPASPTSDWGAQYSSQWNTTKRSFAVSDSAVKEEFKGHDAPADEGEKKAPAIEEEMGLKKKAPETEKDGAIVEGARKLDIVEVDEGAAK
jgi:hypothetical protein